MSNVQFVIPDVGPEIAFREACSDTQGRCGLFWLGGFMSDMDGSKAGALAELAEETGRPFLRFDYSGHGRSGGLFTDGTITQWLAEAEFMFVNKAPGRRIIVGSSMGGWLALLLLREVLGRSPEAAGRVAGLVLIAPAVDMTADLMWDIFPPETRRLLGDTGVHMRPSRYGQPYPITAKLIDDGRRHLMLHRPYECPCPVRILQGDLDEDVPAPHAVRVFEALRGTDVTLTLIKGGDHRLSSPDQLKLIRETARQLAERDDSITN